MDDNNEFEEIKPKKVKLKSEMYNHNNEQIERREEKNSDAIMWGFVLGFLLFLVLLIVIIIFTR